MANDAIAMVLNAPIVLSSILLGAAVFTDVKYRVIPNLLTLPACLAGAAYHVWCSGILEGFCFSMAGLAVGFGLLLIPFLLGGMGGGDVKLMAAVGSFAGASVVVHMVLYGAVAGGVMALGVVLKESGFRGAKNVLLGLFLDLSARQRPRVDSGNPRLPYSVPLAAGFMAYLVFGRIM